MVNDSLTNLIKSVPFEVTTDVGGNSTINTPDDFSCAIGVFIDNNTAGWFARTTYSGTLIYIHFSTYNFSLGANKTFSGTLYYI